MPRTPVPLTVEQLRLRGRYAWWNLTDPDGNVVAEFREEADARAFVALPALETALRSIANSSCCGCCQEAALVAKAALAAADGPVPKE
jgi:hypothetical protein